MPAFFASLPPAQIATAEDSPTGGRAAHVNGMRVFCIGLSPIRFTQVTVATREALFPP